MISRGKMSKVEEKEKYKGGFIKTDNLVDNHLGLYRSYAECKNIAKFKAENPYIKTDIYNKYLEAYRNS